VTEQIGILHIVCYFPGHVVLYVSDKRHLACITFMLNAVGIADHLV